MKGSKRTCCLFLVIFSLLCSLGCLSSSRDTKLNKERLKHQNRIDALMVRIRDLERKISLMGKTSYSLLFTGDILIANELTGYMKKKGVDYPFRKIRNQLKKYDLVFGNLETPIAKTGIPVRNKPYVFSLDPRYKNVFKNIRLNAVFLANNHILDYGVEGMRETIRHLKSMGIRYSGAGENISAARRPVAFHVGTSEILVFSYCRRPPVNFFAGKETPGTAPLYLKYIREDIARYRHRNAVIIISLHWGIEQTSRPQKYQRGLARLIIDAGAHAVIGHHPHWPQGVEVYKKRPVIYSLGNFVNGYYNKVEKDNIFASLHFRGTTLKRLEILPVAGKNKKINFQPSVMKGKAAAMHLKNIQKLSAELNTRLKILKDRGVIIF